CDPEGDHPSGWGRDYLQACQWQGPPIATLTATTTMASPLQWSTDGVAAQEFTGSCHCGNFSFKFEHPAFDKVLPVSCNCSICASRGYILVYVPGDRFKSTKGSWEQLSVHKFNRNMAEHKFCASCGSAIGLTLGADLVAVNLRAVDGFSREELEKLEVKTVDGKSWQ
ncbi:Mss4-like protein, partial [Mycena floridula]